jgi:mannose-6-phosphate isomerase-like protein (cupin superfamily)
MDVPQIVKEVPKVWGKTRSLHIDRNCEVHHATIEPHTWCSRHYHDWKWNLFYVIAGELEVQFFSTQDDTEPYWTAVVRQGQSLKVAPRKWHRFESRCREPVQLIEVYWAEEVLANDIVRADVGGRASHQPPGDPA